MRRLAQLLRRVHPRPPDRQTMPALPHAAWFDDDAAESQIADRATTAVGEAVLRSWVRDGYAIVEGLIPDDLIDAMLADLDGLFDGRSGGLTGPPRDGLVVHDLVHSDGHRAATSHAELHALPVQERLACRDRSNFRVHGLFAHSAAADALRRQPEVARYASMILGVPTEATYSINFHNGSAQALHQDSAVFHLGVANLICGAWIACEDIVEESGPLVYYPGSHRSEMFAGFERYPLNNLRTADGATTLAYQTAVATDAERYERRRFLARKGDVLFWHGMLIHGGERIADPATTRRSYVLHFVPAGADVAHQVVGPTNW